MYILQYIIPKIKVLHGNLFVLIDGVEHQLLWAPMYFFLIFWRCLFLFNMKPTAIWGLWPFEFRAHQSEKGCNVLLLCWAIQQGVVNPQGAAIIGRMVIHCFCRWWLCVTWGPLGKVLRCCAKTHHTISHVASLNCAFRYSCDLAVIPWATACRIQFHYLYVLNHFAYHCCTHVLQLSSFIWLCPSVREASLFSLQNSAVLLFWIKWDTPCVVNL